MCGSSFVVTRIFSDAVATTAAITAFPFVRAFEEEERGGDKGWLGGPPDIIDEDGFLPEFFRVLRTLRKAGGCPVERLDDPTIRAEAIAVVVVAVLLLASLDSPRALAGAPTLRRRRRRRSLPTIDTSVREDRKYPDK